MKLERDMIKATIKDDSGTYSIWNIDWYNQRVYVDRACGCEWVDMARVQLILQSGVEAEACCDHPSLSWNSKHTKWVCLYCGTKGSA